MESIVIETTKTVKELKNQLACKKTSCQRKPSFMQLADSEAVLIAEAHMGEDNDIYVYDNGYVAYREGAHKTVLSAE